MITHRAWVLPGALALAVLDPSGNELARFAGYQSSKQLIDWLNRR